MAINYKLFDCFKLVYQIFVALWIFTLAVHSEHLFFLAENEVVDNHVLLYWISHDFVDLFCGFHQFLNLVLEGLELELFLVVFAEFVNWLAVAHVLT